MKFQVELFTNMPIFAGFELTIKLLVFTLFHLWWICVWNFRLNFRSSEILLPPKTDTSSCPSSTFGWHRDLQTSCLKKMATLGRAAHPGVAWAEPGAPEQQHMITLNPPYSTVSVKFSRMGPPCMNYWDDGKCWILSCFCRIWDPHGKLGVGKTACAAWKGGVGVDKNDFPTPCMHFGNEHRQRCWVVPIPFFTIQSCSRQPPEKNKVLHTIQMLIADTG